MIEDRVISEVYAHAGACYPNECCGFIRETSAGPEAIPVRNRHTMPRSHFKISPEDYITYAGGALCMYHSHPDGPATASEADQGIARSTSLPQLVVNWPHGQLSVHGRKPGPLKGRPFIYGVYDCYSLVRDYYLLQFGIEMLDYVRPRYGWWEVGGCDPFMKYYEHAGFYTVTDDIQIGDLVVMRLSGSSKPNHIGVIDSDWKLLHHRLNSFACTVSYDGYYEKNTMMVLRYGS